MEINVVKVFFMLNSKLGILGTIKELWTLEIEEYESLIKLNKMRPNLELHDL